MIKRTGTLLTAALLGLTATIGWAGPAAAAPADAPTVTVSRLVLEPTERGYRGSIRVTVTNNSDSTDHVTFQIREAVAGSFSGGPESLCESDGVSEGRLVRSCAFPRSSELAPGERRQATVDFQVLTSPRSYPMIADGGLVTVQSANVGSLETIPFSARFRSLDGTLTRPQTYVQDALTNASVELIGPVTDGPENTRRVPFRVRYSGDARQLANSLTATPLPAGSMILFTEPFDGPVYSAQAFVPGGLLMQGEERDVALYITRPTDPADESNPITLELKTHYWDETVPDVDPSDNTVTFNLALPTS
ncbi:hypothetical protein O7634_06070 [Micromonospora sp. WMMD1120]|uniref:hypothetical protein n=1 Tax=Micromonospora sp. WMMD1120 TaxID=3016106 RepID=UPI0024179B4B|nr:hypothetical protein [Micromonospora sp. WMMD1120]MDG4806318.1 hypothetical protein [Micromonospora sp. WMMD1120]